MAKTEKEKPVAPKDIFGAGYKRETLPEGKTTSLITQADMGLKDSDFEDYGSIHVGEDINKIREKNQSAGEQFGSFLTQSVVGEIIGGAISGIGATLDIPDAIISEFKDKDADFKNLITEAGDAITQWSKDVAPIYRKNPGKSFDVTDSGWWFESGVNTASVLGLLIPSMGAVKGLSYVSKLVGLADELALANKLGKTAKWAGNLEKAKYFGKIATSAIVSRNAENFKESAQVLTDTKANLLKEWDENPDKFKELLNSDVAKELQAEGRTVDKENLANFISSKAAWLSYGVNSLNIAFDALQLAPLFKGFKPVTQISKLETSVAIKKAQKEALGKTFSKMDYLTSSLNPLSSAFARNASEGLEEAINYVGTEEGKAYADQLTGKKTKDLSGRIGDYLVDPKMYESAVWGVLGGMVFGGTANALGRVANLVKGKDGYGLKEARIDEINKRVSQIKETSEAIKQIENDSKLNDEEKSHYIANIKADAITKLTINAAQVGNYNMLIEHLSSPQMRKEMIDNGYAKEEDVDKAIAKSLLDAQTAVDIYKSNYNLFQTRKIDEQTKNIQIAEKTYWDSVSKKHLEQKGKLIKDIEILKGKDNYINTTTDKDVNLTIELTALKVAKKSVENITENSNEPLSQYQKEILSTIDKKIINLESQIKEKASLNTINPTIIEKQIKVEQKNMIIEALGHKAKYMTTPEYSEKIKKETEEASKKRKEKDINDFKESIKDKSKAELELLKTTTKDKAKKDIIDSSIKDLTKKAESTKRKETVLKTKEVKENTKPTRTDDAIFDMFDEEFETKKIDETKLNPEIKQLIDNAINTKNYGSLLAGDAKYNGTLEQQYLRNKVTEIKQNLLNPVNEAKENLNLNTKEENIIEPILDDKAINDEINRNKPKIKNGDIFGKEVSSVDADIKPFIHILKPLNFNGEIQINEDKNGNLILTAELDKSVKALYSLKPTDKIEVKVDNTNKYYEQYKEDAKNIPLAIYLQGEKIGYLSTLRNLDYQVSQQTIDENNQEIELIKQIRNEIGTDLTKSTELVVKRLQKGTIINTKEYYPVKNLNGVTDESFWIVKTDTDNSFILENLKTGEIKPHFNELRKGVIYVGVQNLDDTFFPSPLNIGKLDENDSKIVEKHIFDLLDVLDSGLSVISKEANDLKDKISNYIRVDNTENYFKEEKQIQTLFKELQNLQKNKESEERFKEEIKQKQAYYKELRSKRNLSFRVHEKNKDGKAARVEIGYVSPNTGEKRHITLYKTSLILRDENETKIATVRITNVNGVLRYFDEDNKQIKENPLQKILQHRYKNINFKAFKQDKAYRDKMLNSNVLLTNVGELRTSTGKTISNFTDFKPVLTTKKEVEQTEKESKPNPTNQEVKDNTNNNIDQAFEGIFDKQVSEKVVEVENKTSKEILTDIVKNAESKTIKDAAEFALQHIEKNNVIVKYVSNLPDTTPATYNVTTNTIQINKNVKNQKEFQENFLHEVYHALTLLPLIKHINFKVTKENELDYNDFEFKPNTPKEVKDFIQQITNLRKETERKIRQKYPDITKASIEEKYGIKNNFEFISEVITNPQFREFLKAGDISIFEKILDAIVTFLNKYLNTNLSLNKSKDLDNSVKIIFNYISAQNAENYKKLENGVEHIFNSEFAEFKKTRSEKTFTNEELSELVNFTSFASLKYYKNGTNLQNVGDNTDTSKKESLKAKEFVKKAFNTLVEKSKDKVTPAQSVLLNKALENFDIIWAETTRQINRTFGVDIEINDINLDDTVQQNKQWEAKFTEMLPLSKEIKYFLSTFVAKNSDGTLKINPVTGLNVIVPFKEIITPIKVNLTKANNTQEVLTILNEMKALNPVYGDIANALSQDFNKLNAFKTTFSGYIVKSRLNLLRKTYKDAYKAKSINELEFAQAYIKIAKEWSDIIDANIQKGIYNTEEFRTKKTELDKKVSLYVNKEFNFKDENGDLNKEGEELISTFKELVLLYELPIKSITIESNIFNARNLDDTFYKALQGIGTNIKNNIENNSTGDLRSISKIEENFNFKYAHLMGQNAKGEMISAYNLNSFMSNYMKRLKSTDKATRQEVENEFRKIVDLDPTAQYQFWFWNTSETVGLFNYDIVNGKKIPTTLNQKFIDLLDIENIGGVKNETTKEALESSELASFDELVNYAVAYLAPTEAVKQKQNNYIYIPSITQSDSQNQTYIKVPRVPINSTDISFEYSKTGAVKAVKINENSLIFKQFQNIVAQEVARRLQASNYMFDSTLSSENTKLKDNERLIVNPKYFDYNTNSLTEEGKKWFATLETTYHYEKIVYKKNTNEVDLLNTLFKDGKLTGKVFTFHNIKEINNVEAFKTAYFTPLTVSDFKSITPTIQKYLNKILLEEFKDWKEVNNTKILDGLYSHIGNGSFESFISEFALNVYLGNAQQQMWFNGVTAQFKKIGEVGKRGKLPNAPGTPNTSSNQKRVFGAITIEDVNLQGKNVDFIAINQRDYLIKEQRYKFTKEEIDTFNLDNILKDLGETYKDVLTNNLELETYKLIKNYLNINSADAQGYMTVQGLKDVLISHGKMNATYEAIFKQIESGEQLSVQAIKTIQATKYLYFYNSFNETLNKMSPNAIKNSYVILIPQLIKGTELEKINEIMIKKGASRLFMESAHKIGAKKINKITNDDGSLNEAWLNEATVDYYDFLGEQEQLTIPDHLVDYKQLLATQISKLIINNLSNNADYTLYNKKLTGTELRDLYFSLISKNIEESTEQLIEDLKITKDENGDYKFENLEALQKILLEEIQSRGEAKSLEDAISIVNNEFLQPLSMSKNAEKFESILTSLFTNRIMKQKLPGALVVNQSDLFITKTKTNQENSNITGIEWQNGHDGVLKAYKQNENGVDVDVVEVVMGSWSSQFFKDGKRISINDIPDDVKTMIGYRIPTSGKNLMVVFKVVGFLPEESKGTIIMPNNLIAQMGLDFDIDKMNIIYKHFFINKKGEFKIPTYGTKEEFDYLSEKLKELNTDKLIADSTKDDKATTKLIKDIFGDAGETELDNEIEEVKQELKQFGTFDESGKFVYNEQKSGRKSRDNTIIDIFKSILLNKNHLAESFSDINFETYEKFKEQIESINHKNDDNLDILSAKGQRLVKKRNMAGVVLKGLTANSNAFVPIAQQVGMELIDKLAIPVKYRISGQALNENDRVYDLKALKKKYPNLTVEGNYAIIKHKKYGKTESGEYTNVDGRLIDMVVGQSLAASVDNASKPVFDSFNGTTYTLPQFQTALTLGIPDTYMMSFTSQPILVKLNNEFFNNKGVLIDNTDESKVREKVRATYENLLFNLLVEDGQFKATKHSGKTIRTNPKVYTAEKRQILFNYSLESEKVFSEGELWNMIVQSNKWGTISAVENKEDLKEKIEYLRNQLYILNQFNKNKEAGDATQDILRATKTDGLGAGSSLSTSVDLFNLIYKVGKDNKIVTDKGISAISSIYPKFFGLNSKSTYLPLETLLLNVNKLSFDILGNLFIEQNPSFKAFKQQVKTFKKDKKEDKKIKQFFNKTLYQDFDMFNGVDFKLILGLENNNIKTINTITDFQNSTLEEQFNYIKKHNKDNIEKSYNHILNNISFTNDIAKNGFVTLDFNTNYKDVSLDDTFSEQIENLYESGDEYNKMFVENLIKYTYFVHGLEFQFGSLIRVIPSTVLSESNVIDYYRKQLKNTINVDVDKYYKNNWLNTNIVPLVATKSVYNEEDDSYSTVNNTPVWDGNQDVLKISSKSLSNEKDNVKNSPYIRISTSTTTFDEEKKPTTTFENHLYKRHKEIISFSETSKYNKVKILDEQTGKYKYLNVSINEENGNLKIGDREYDINSENINELEQIYEIIPNTIYFYKVNPLGKNSFIEVTNESIFEENNKVKEYNVLLDLENKISGVDINKIEVTNNNENIYNKLGNKTKSENVVIKSWGELKNVKEAIVTNELSYKDWANKVVGRFVYTNEVLRKDQITDLNNTVDLLIQNHLKVASFAKEDLNNRQYLPFINRLKENGFKQVEGKEWLFTKNGISPEELYNQYKNQISQIISTRIRNTNEHFGNPFSHDPAGKTQGLIKTETVQEAVEKYIDWVINGANFEKKNLFTVKPIQSVDKKATVKASIATQYIGFGEGINNSSTELYRQQAGKYANTGNYSERDTVFVSIGGKRGTEQQQKEQQDKTIKEALKAIEDGAILITDNKSYVDSNSYNTGEKRLAQNLTAKGYNYTEKTIDGQVLGVWYKGELNPLRSEWIREELKSEKHKGKTILYYKELGEPSHATALDYLINNYNIKEGEQKQNIQTTLDFTNIPKDQSDELNNCPIRN